jgi:hypothetical protein
MEFAEGEYEAGTSSPVLKPFRLPKVVSQRVITFNIRILKCKVKAEKYVAVIRLSRRIWR